MINRNNIHTRTNVLYIYKGANAMDYKKQIINELEKLNPKMLLVVLLFIKHLNE